MTLKQKSTTAKVIIFDASTLISFAMACLYYEFRKLKDGFDGKFLITKEVKNEVIDKPMAIPRFQLEGIKLQQLLDDKILELPESLGISDEEVSKKTEEVMNISNSTFRGRDGDIKFIDIGEASCLALGKVLGSRKIKNTLAVDERAMRSLCETPESFRKYLEKKMHSKISIKKENLFYFKGFKIIRSIELIYVAYKKGMIKLKNKKLLESLIYALRYKGASISNEDIAELKKIG